MFITSPEDRASATSATWPRRACHLTLALLLLSCREEIIHDVDEETANQVLAGLASAGLDGEKARQASGSTATYTVSVPRAAASRAWTVLRQQNLPRPRRQGLGEVFGTPSLVPTATQEQALMHHALAGELSRSLQSVPNVLEARVHLVLPTRDTMGPLGVPPPQGKAGVLLRVSAAPPLKKPEIQRLVAGAVRGLTADQVSVVLVHVPVDPAPSKRLDSRAALADLGPFQVARTSRAPLLATLLTLLLLLALLGAYTLVLLRRSRTASPRPTEAHWDDSAAADLSPRIQGSLSLLERSINSRQRRDPPSIAGGMGSS